MSETTEVYETETITEERPSAYRATATAVDGTEREMPGKRTYQPTPWAADRQRARMRVRVSREVKRGLDERGVYSERRGQETLQREAIGLELIEAMALLEAEPVSQEGYTTLWVSPTSDLIIRSRFLHVPPHILVRAAANKLGLGLVTTRSIDGGVVVGVEGPIPGNWTERIPAPPEIGGTLVEDV